MMGTCYHKVKLISESDEIVRLLSRQDGVVSVLLALQA